MIKNKYVQCNIKVTMKDTKEHTQHFLFLTSGLGKVTSGIESSMLKRSKIFIDQLGIQPVFITVFFSLPIERIIEELKQEKKIPKSFLHVNLYQFFQLDVERVVLSTTINNSKSENKQVSMYHENQKTMTKVFNLDTGRLSFVNYFDHKNRIYRLEQYDLKGYLSRSVLYQFNPHRKTQVTFYRADGSIGFQKYFIREGNEDIVSRIVIYAKDNTPKEIFYNEDELHAYLLKYYVNSFPKCDRVNIIGDRLVRLAESLKDNFAPLIKVFPVIHSLHIENPEDVNSNFKYYYFNKLESSDGIIILTEAQREDVIHRCGDFNNLYTIPHSVNYYPTPVTFNERKDYKVVAVGRFMPVKNYRKMINIFANVIKKLPMATLDIYGFGPLESELKSQVEMLGLQENIQLHPFTDNVYDKFSEAKLSLLTSDYEGFGLVILESLCSGCPVIANNVRYGPADMIENGKNGYLINKYDNEDFANKIITVLSDKVLNKNLSMYAYESSQKFSAENIGIIWKNFINKISKN